MNSEAVFCDICGEECKSERGLLYHKLRSFRHNNNNCDNTANNFLNFDSICMKNMMKLPDYLLLRWLLFTAAFQIIVGCIPDYLMVRWVLFIPAFQVFGNAFDIIFAEYSIIYYNIPYYLLLNSTLFTVVFQIIY